MDTQSVEAVTPQLSGTATTTYIRVVEVWVPDAEGALLVLGSAWYGAAKRFGMKSQQMCFGRGEGLPGQAWEAGRPIVLHKFEGSAFRRTEAAHADGLTCGIALPVFSGDVLNAVVLIFCGDNDVQAGAIELWRNEAAVSKDLVLDDGYYGSTSNVLEFISRRTAFRKGTGLPALAWATGQPVDMGSAEDRVEKGQGTLGQAFASGVPLVSQQALTEPGGVGSAARAVGLDTVVALPVLQHGHVVAVVAWYF